MSNVTFAIMGIVIGLLFTVAGIFQAFAPETWANLPIHGKPELIMDRTKWKRAMTGTSARFFGCLIGLFGLFVTVQFSIFLFHLLPTTR